MAQLSTRYATALFELAVENGSLDVIFEQASAVCGAFRDGDSQRFMKHPDITKAEKYIFADDITGKLLDNVNPDLKGFLHLLISKSRENIIASALDSFINMANAYRKRTTATVVSAIPLGESQIDNLRNTLAAKIGKQVEINLQLDPSLIGGFYIKVDGFLADRSVRNQINDIRELLI
jgi:F-type H+-transporting ATPase subunit delta